MEWNHHHERVRWLFKSFNLMSGSMLDFVHDERDRKYLVISEAEWTSLVWIPQVTSIVRGWSSLTDSSAGHDV